MTSLPAIPKALAMLQRPTWVRPHKPLSAMTADEREAAREREGLIRRVMRTVRRAVRAVSRSTAPVGDHLASLPSDHEWRTLTEQMYEHENPYGAIGQWGVLHALMTGDWAGGCEEFIRRLEWNTLYLNTTGDRSHTREHAIFMGWAAHSLDPHFTTEQRTHVRGLLEQWRDHMLAFTAVGDSDEAVGHFFALLIIGKYLGDDPYQYRLMSPWSPDDYPFVDVESGLAGFREMAWGGEWLEGSSYNDGTTQLIALGVLLDGPENHPEWVAWLKDCAENLLWNTSADRKHMARWGDNQSGSTAPNHGAVLPLCALLYRVTGDERMLHLLAEWLPYAPIGRWQYNVWRMFIAVDPAQIPAEPIAHNPQGFRRTGVGLCIFRDGLDMHVIHQQVRAQWVDHSTQHQLPTVSIYDGEQQAWRIMNRIEYIPETYNHTTARVIGLPDNSISTLLGFHEQSLDVAEATDYGYDVVGSMGGPHRIWGNWFPLPIMDDKATLEYQWHKSEGRLHIAARAKLLRPVPSSEQLTADGYGKHEQDTLAKRAALMELVLQRGTYKYTTTATALLSEERRFRLLDNDEDGDLQLGIDADLYFAAAPAEALDPPQFEGEPTPPPVEPPPGSTVLNVVKVDSLPASHVFDGVQALEFTPPPFASFEAWFDGEGVLLGQSATTGYVPLVHLGTDRRLRTSLVWHGSTAARLASEPLDAGQHHVAVTYDGETETLYIDGAKVAEQQQPQLEYADAYRYFLGTGYTAHWEGGNGGWHYFAGTIAGAKVHPGVLTAEQVQASFVAGPGAEPPPVEPPPVEPPPSEPPTDILAELRAMNAKLDTLLNRTYKVTPNAP